MPYYTEYEPPDAIASNDKVIVYRAYEDEDWEKPYTFHFTPAPIDAPVHEVEYGYEEVDIRDLGYTGGSPTAFVKENLHLFIPKPIKPF